MPSAFVVFFKPSCSKCRSLLGILKDEKIECDFVEYLKTPPSEIQISDFVERSGRPIKDFIRTSEPLYQKKFSGKKRTDKQWIKILAKNPELLQRPIVVHDNQVWIARDEESISQVIALNKKKP